MDEPDSLWGFLPYLLQGIPITLLVMVLSMVVAVMAAIVLALGRSSSHALLRWPAGFVIELFRGSSALVQLFWAFYVLPFFGVVLTPFAASVIVLGINSGSYLSEVVRAGLSSVPSGQREAAITLGFSARYRFFRVILPQALPIMIPPFGNALVTMLKFTALVSLVTIQDLTFRTNLVATSLGESGNVYLLAIVIYFVIASALAFGTRWLERLVNGVSGRNTQSAATVRVSNSRLGNVRAGNVPRWAFGADQ